MEVVVVETTVAAVMGVHDSFLFNGRGVHNMGGGSTGEGVVTHELEATTCGSGGGEA